MEMSPPDFPVYKRVPKEREKQYAVLSSSKRRSLNI